jgi:hypothetical protein
MMKIDASAAGLIIRRIGNYRIKGAVTKKAISFSKVSPYNDHSGLKFIQLDSSAGSAGKVLLDLKPNNAYGRFPDCKAKGYHPAAGACIQNAFTRFRASEPRKDDRVLADSISS